MYEFFQDIEPAFLVSICLGMIATGVVLVLGILHWVFVLKFISNEQIRTDMYWLVFMGPVVSLCGAIGMLVPRAAIFLYAIALVYFMICIFVLVCIMTTLHGSREAMCEKLTKKGVKISAQVCPIGCCFFCLPKIEPSQFNFRRLEWLVFQSPIVRIFLEMLNIIVFMEINSRVSLFFQMSNLIGMISLFIGSYGSYMVIPAGSSLLGEYRFLLLFRLVDFSQLAWSVQKFVFEFLAFPGLKIFNSETLPATAKAQFCISFLLCLEMLIVSLLATWMFRPSQTWFFDKYRRCGLVGGRGCRIADSSFMDEPIAANGVIRIYDSNGDEEDGAAAVPKFSNGSLRLEQVRLNGSGHTVVTSAEADDASSQRRLFAHQLQQQQKPRQRAATAGDEPQQRRQQLVRQQQPSSASGSTPRSPPEAEEEEQGQEEFGSQSTVSASTNSSSSSNSAEEQNHHQQRRQQNDENEPPSREEGKEQQRSRERRKKEEEDSPADAPAPIWTVQV